MPSPSSFTLPPFPHPPTAHLLAFLASVNCVQSLLSGLRVGIWWLETFLSLLWRFDDWLEALRLFWRFDDWRLEDK